MSPSNLLSAESEHKPIADHLEYLGYQCDVVEQGLRARHGGKFTLLASVSREGIQLQTGFPGKGVSSENNNRYELINNLNARLLTSRIFWTAEGHLFMSAWMPGLYDKTRFALFIDAWERDGEVLREAARALNPYLKQ
ncbi:MAG TPA: hypothetical protein VJ692_16815 [Nitrospiraceae bacterium]|nr:hypothetical protein [Nitrospiraceae bacterium]